jgi:rhodanese-related sulfurtransferase
VALQLRRQGIKRVRPLAGGLAAWREHNFPVHTPELVLITPPQP